MRNLFCAVLSVIITGYIILTLSCTPEACFEETNSFLKASLYDNVTKKLKSPDSLTVYGLNRDTAKIYDQEKGVQPALFPLDSSTGTCTFIVRINGVNDTITFNYSSYPHLISKECGYTFFHNIDTPVYTKNKIEYIFTGLKNVTTENVENIRIFF